MLCHQVWLFSSSHPTPSPGATDRLVKAIRSAPRRHKHTIEAPRTEKETLTNVWALTYDMMFPARRSQRHKGRYDGSSGEQTGESDDVKSF